MSDSDDDFFVAPSAGDSSGSSSDENATPTSTSQSTKRKRELTSKRKGKSGATPGSGANPNPSAASPDSGDPDTKPTPKKRKAAGPTKLATTVPLVMGGGKKTAMAVLMQSPSLDLRGDVAIIGRAHVDPKEEVPISLDIKGIVYQGTARPCSSFAVIEISGSGDSSIAKITHLANSYIEVQAETDTLVESVLEGDVGDEDDLEDYVTADTVKGANSTSMSMKAVKSRKKSTKKKTPAKRPTKQKK
eukprot:m.229984 g.229984  ORF g.229984 m.229984 type:complete len:246 (-) comp26014_c0_seq1:2864-3601(-)